MAFSLVEALVALAITAVAGAALLLSLNSNIALTEHTEQHMIAQGMARQLMDEVVGTRYMALNTTPYQTNFTPSSWEAETGTRERFDDIDDYDSWATQPPVDEYGVPLGTENGQEGQRSVLFRVPDDYLDRWQQEISVQYVNPSDLSEGLSGVQTSNYRAVQVRILYNDPERGSIELAKMRRVVPYVPTVVP